MHACILAVASLSIIPGAYRIFVAVYLSSYHRQRSYPLETLAAWRRGIYKREGSFKKGMNKQLFLSLSHLYNKGLGDVCRMYLRACVI